MNARLPRSIEPLEPRIAPANLIVSNLGKTAKWTDVDGDLVTLTTNKSILDPGQFHFLDQQPGDLGFQLAQLDLTQIFTDGVSLAFTARRDPVAKVGDGFVNVGWIKAFSDFTTISIPGDLGRITAGNAIDATPAIGSLTVHSAAEFGIGTQIAAMGDLVNGETATTDWVVRGRLGTLLVKGDFMASLRVGGASQAAAGSIGSATVWGDLAATDKSLTASTTTGTGYISASGAIGSVRLLGSVNGGPDQLSGSINSDTSIASVWIHGNVSGGRGDLSGSIISLGPIGSVFIGGSLYSGGSREENNETVPSSRAGSVSSSTHLGKVTVMGDVVGGASIFGGSIFTALDGGGKIDSVTIGGRLLGSTQTAQLMAGPKLIFNGIYSDGTLGPVKIGTIQGVSPTQTADIIARGVINPRTAAEATAMAGITVTNGVVNANIFAGYRIFTAVNPDVQIGPVKVGTNWIGSNLVAGVVPGTSHIFGGSDDVVIPAMAPVSDNPAIPAKIASFTTGGYLAGSTTAGDTYGIEAQLIGAVKIGLTVLPMTTNSGFTPADDFILGVTHDVHIREV